MDEVRGRYGCVWRGWGYGSGGGYGLRLGNGGRKREEGIGLEMGSTIPFTNLICMLNIVYCNIMLLTKELAVLLITLLLISYLKHKTLDKI